jgi:hypothetical protein
MLSSGTDGCDGTENCRIELAPHVTTMVLPNRVAARQMLLEYSEVLMLCNAA